MLAYLIAATLLAFPSPGGPKKECRSMITYTEVPIYGPVVCDSETRGQGAPVTTSTPEPMAEEARLLGQLLIPEDELLPLPRRPWLTADQRRAATALARTTPNVYIGSYASRESARVSAHRFRKKDRDVQFAARETLGGQWVVLASPAAAAAAS